MEHDSYLPVWGFITYVTKWRRKPTVDFIHCQLFLGGFIDCLEKEVSFRVLQCLYFSEKTFACSNLKPRRKTNLKLPNKQAGWHCTPFSMYVSRTLPFVRGEIDRWWCWWWRVYLPTSRISAEIAKRRCKPSVDFVKRQLLLGGFSYCLEKRQSPVTLSTPDWSLQRKWIESYLHFLKVCKVN